MNSVQIGGLIKALRQRRGWTQEELADKLYVSQSDISKFENDRMLPDLPTFFRIAHITNAPEVIVAFLYGLDGLQILQNLSAILGGFILWS